MKKERMSLILSLCFSRLFKKKLINIIQEDEAVIHERKMKAEEEEVDIDSVTTLAGSGRGPGTTSAAGGNSNLSATGTGSATPVLTSTQSGTGIGNGHTPMTVDGAIGKFGPPSTGVYAAMVGVNGDIDSAWAEEEPDGDEPGDWKMEVAMENEEGPGYY
jgi:COMPASS component SWD1